MWYGAIGYVESLIRLLYIALMWLILLDMDIFLEYILLK